MDGTAAQTTRATLRVALWALPLASAQAELDADIVADVEAIELLAAIAGELELDHLGILRVVRHLDDELALLEAVSDLLRLEDRVELSADFNSHGARG